MEKLNELCSICDCSVSVDVNPHRDYYDSVESYLEDHIEEVEADVYEKMVETNTIIWVQAYPNTPTGFYKSYHYDLETAISEVLEAVKKSKK